MAQKKSFGSMRLARRLALGSAAIALAIGLAGCQSEDYLPQNSRHYVPVPARTLALMSEKNMTKDAPILIRTYKQESEFEVWKRTSEGKYAHLKTFPMCRWSGQLGPKVREGDRQVPEGFYAITPGQLNPNSNYYLSFNVGYPNQLDKAYGRTGGLIMVHGACSSAGCMSMTDEQIAEIYALTRDAFTGGQQQVQMQSMPFRMTAHNLAKFRADPNIAFWKNLKEGSDHFEVTQQEPKVGMCGRKYVFDADSKGKPLDATQPCPALTTDTALASAVGQKEHDDEVKVAELVSQGVKAVRKTYIDGDQHPSFRATASIDGTIATRAGRRVDVSQLDALAVGGTEVAVEDRSSHAPAKAPKTIVALQPPVAASVAPTVAGSSPVLALASEPSAARPAASPLARIEPIVQASASQASSSPATAEARAAGQPFYQRWLGGGGEEAKAEVQLETETAFIEPSIVPLPPRSPIHLGLKAAKPVTASKEKQAALPAAIKGGKPLVPASGKLSYASSLAQ